MKEWSVKKKSKFQDEISLKSEERYTDPELVFRIFRYVCV